jgi:hypothetical protein
LRAKTSKILLQQYLPEAEVELLPWSVLLTAESTPQGYSAGAGSN